MPFPQGRDEAAAQRLIEAFPAAVDARLRPLLHCLGGNSPYLAGLALREPDTVQALVAQGPDAVCDLALGRLAALAPRAGRAETAAALRLAKRQVALATAYADIGGIWTLEQVTGALSDLADAALRVSVRHLLREAHEKKALRLPYPSAPDKGSGFTVLAMGKLGARELNYSSDVDLILIWDAAAHPYTADSNGATFSRLARDLVSLMQAHEWGGIVFRTDLRLRPDPGSTPPAVRLDAALSYYESAALTWERAAMIKARPVAGDPGLGRRFLESIRPFIWRRHLDFAAIGDIRAMKERVDAHKGTALGPGGGAASLLGHDLKLGEGGIREVEFTAQTLQLVWGGRNPLLRAPGTLAALRAATASGLMAEEDRQALESAYRLLRRLEHRLQMVADRQTHALPGTLAGLEDFAAFFGEPNADALAATLVPHLRRVQAAFSGLLAAPVQPPDLDGETPAGSSRPYDSPPGDSPPGDSPPGDSPPAGGRASVTPAAQEALAPWEEWLNGRPRALRTERARALLRDMLPELRRVVDSQPDPRGVWLRLDDFIRRLPAGVQFFSLLQHNPALLDRLGAVLGAAPFLAGHLADVPAALEGFLAPQPVDPDPAATLRAQLHDAAALDVALGVASRFVRGEEFRLAVAELDGRIDQDMAGAARTSIAEAAIRVLLPRVMAEHRRRYGRVPGGSLSVVALGKAGSREMMAGSDLDLMLIYDHPEDAPESDGRTRLPASQYFARAAQALVAALTVPTRDGKLYDVDMRLRPSGGKGPVAVSLSSFARYHRESAWTWERLALTRARVVAGPVAARARVEAAIGRALDQGNPALVAADTLAMRRRLLAELPPKGPWDVKLRRGGLMELEFVVQSLQLRSAGQTPLAGGAMLAAGGRASGHASGGRGGGRIDVFDPCTRRAIGKLRRAAALDDAEAADLVAADAAWRAVQGLLRIAMGRAVPQEVPQALQHRLAGVLDRISGLPGPGTLAERLDAVAERVGAAFRRHIGDISEASCV